MNLMSPALPAVLLMILGMLLTTSYLMAAMSPNPFFTMSVRPSTAEMTIMTFWSA